MNRKILIIVDPQNDFVADFGSLKVEGAQEKIENICKLIRKCGDLFSEIYVSLDSHQKYHSSNSEFWKGHLSIGTKITPENIDQFTPKHPEDLDKVKVLLNRETRREITIWPEHCLLGTWGWCIYDKLAEVLHEWTIKTGRVFNEVLKGKYPWKEEYSMFSGGTLGITDAEVYVCGVAGDYCVRCTVEDLVSNSKQEKIVLLEDCIATIDPDAEDYTAYLEHMKSIGVKIVSSEIALKP